MVTKMWKKDSTDDKNDQTNGMEINLITWQHTVHTQYIQHSPYEKMDAV